MDPPARLAIPTCAGCGAMREYESCTGSCSERRLELVSAGDYDTLTVAGAARRARIAAYTDVVEELALSDPGPDQLRSAYEGLRESARSALRHHGPELGSGDEDPPASVDTVVVWRCPECGGLDAPQPCIGVCVWRPVEWVSAELWGSERARSLVDRRRERSLAGLLGRLAFATPREGEWERTWRTLRTEAQLARRGAEE